MGTIPDPQFEEKIFEIDHILDQIHHYTNQGRAKVFVPSKVSKSKPKPVYSTVPTTTPKKSSYKPTEQKLIKKDLNIRDVLATHQIFQSSFGIKYI